MEKIILIDPNKCIRCQKCVKVCPAQLFETSEAGVSLSKPQACILCGHCVAICPQEAIQHNFFPKEKVHDFDPSLLPTPEQMLLLCRARRSNRAFSKEAIPMASLDLIIEAAHRAPTASNKQELAMTLITDPEKLRLISEYTLGTLKPLLKLLTNPILKPILKLVMPQVFGYVPTFQRLLKEYEQGHDGILRQATAVLFFHAPIGNRFASEDANLAYQNASLMAESLRISQFYTGFVLNAVKRDKKHNLEKQLNIPGKIAAGMALGLPQFTFSRYIDKQPPLISKC